MNQGAIQTETDETQRRAMTTVEKSKVFVVELGEQKRLSSEALRELLTAVLGRGQQFRFRAGGTSMFPFIRNGDVVTVSPLREADPGMGDIVAFLQSCDRSLVLHRIVGVENGAFVVRGDSALHADGMIPGEDILGRVVRIERQGREVWPGSGAIGRLIAFLSRMGITGAIGSLALKAIAFFRRGGTAWAATPGDGDDRGK